MNVSLHRWIGGLLSASVTVGLVASGCANDPKSSPAPVSRVQTPSAPISRTDGYYFSAVAAIERRDYARALEALQAARQIAPSDVRVLNAFGIVYDKLGRFDLSARYYAQAKGLDPTSPTIQANMAYSALLSGAAQSRSELATSGPSLSSPGVVDAAPAATAVAALPSLSRPAVAAPAAAPVQAVQARAPAVAPVPPARIALVGPGPIPSLNADLPARLPLAAPAGPKAQASTPATAAPTPGGRDKPRAVAQAKPAAPIAGRPPPLPLTVAKLPARYGFTVARPPLYIVNASGQSARGEPIRGALASRGWSTPRWALLQGPVQGRSTIHFPPSRQVVASALAATLPSRPQLVPCDCAGLTLVLGSDAKRWPAMSQAKAAKKVVKT